MQKNKSLKISFIYLSVLVLYSIFSFSYNDIIETTQKSYMLLDSIFLNSNTYLFESAFYITTHITFAIWSIPVWLLFKIVTIPNMLIVSTIWSKILILLFLLFLLLIIYKILVYANVQNTCFWLFLLSTSIFVFLPIFEMCQYDVIGLTIGLSGIYLTLKDDKITIRALLLFCLSSSYKLLFVFPILCFILLREKNLKKLVFNFSIIFIPNVLLLLITTIIRKIQYIELNSYKSTELVGVFFDRLFESCIPGGMYNVSIFFVIFFIMLIYCYREKEIDTNLLIYKFSWVSFIIYSSMLQFCVIHPQWCIYLAVFIILLFALSNNTDSFSLLLETFFELIVLLQQICTFDWVYLCKDNYNFLLLKNLINNSNINSLGLFFKNYGIDKFFPIITALQLSIVIYLVYMLSPYNNKKINNKYIFGKYRILILVLYFTISFIFIFI